MVKDITKKKKENSENNTSATPYDDVFRTMLNDCSSLVLPLINEVFHEHYTGNEKIIFYQNEHFLNGQDGKEEKCITDSSFEVMGERKRKYHFECQSTSDSHILIRMFEYGSQIALDDAETDGNVLHVKFPDAAVLFLRSSSKTPDAMQINIKTPGGEVCYEIPVMKMQKYTLEEIFEKNLLFLIPFYIFTHEKRFKEYDTDDEKLKALVEEYRDIRDRLEHLMEENVIDEFTKCTIVEMSDKVMRNIAKRFPKIRKGVKMLWEERFLNMNRRKY